jgi:hypothetical protein
MCYVFRMSLWATIRRLLPALAIVGLVLAPVVQPVMAADMQATADNHAAMSIQADVAMDDMPCCPDEQKTDCAKSCPFMAACTAQLHSTVPSFGFSVPVMQASVIKLHNDRTLHSLSQAPPPRPPKA